MSTVTNQNEVLTPGGCLIMISFNDASAGPDAEALAHFLTMNGSPTFCTRIYCPTNCGKWSDATEKGAARCKIYIPLVTKGWQESHECQYETALIRQRFARKEVTIIPVYYTDFDEAYDEKEEGHNYKFKWNDVQSVYREEGDEGEWMNTILKLLPKANNPDLKVSSKDKAAKKAHHGCRHCDEGERDSQRKSNASSTRTQNDRHEESNYPTQLVALCLPFLFR
jgi:hypothetical protein